MRIRRTRLPVTAFALLGGALGGCGGSTPVVPGGADPSQVMVIKQWSDTLTHGDVRHAADYFAIPSDFSNGGQGMRIESRGDAEQVNADLPCGAHLVRASPHGPYIDALFRLSGRPGPGGSRCGGTTTETARTFFLIRGGKIAVWLRAPDEPGDNTGPPAQTTTGPVI